MFGITEGEFNVVIAISILIAVFSIPLRIPPGTTANIIEVFVPVALIILNLRRASKKQLKPSQH